MAASPSPSLAVPGSSSYSSNTLHVGDGTWDASRDTFLLPNIEGLPFDAMRYNGMGNRFRTLDEYHTIITAHGIIAAITFLGIVPAAIFIASFYHRNPRLALRMHITLQVLTVILTTVIFVLGYFAVGPARSLTNPHHGIGLAIFLLVLFQAIGGWLIKKIEKGKVRYHIPIKLMLHQWLGRGIALLAIAQVAIGLTLYGSPKSLFILYALWMVILLVTYFVLTYRNHVRAAGAYDDGSYVTRTHSDYTDDRQSHHPKTKRRLEEAAGAVGLGAALAALRRRSSGRRERQGYADDQTDISARHDGHRPAPSESIVDEKFTESDYMSRQHTWRDRLLGAGAGIGGIAAVRKLFKGRRVRDDDYIDDESQAGPYRPPLGVAQQPPMTQSQMHLAQMEGGYGGPGYNPAGGPPGREGQIPGMTLADGPGNQHASSDWARVEQQEAAQEAAMHRRGRQSPGESEHSYSTYQSQRKPFFSRVTALPASLAAAGGLGAFWRKRRDRKEQEAVEAQRQQDIEQERIFRATHAPYSDDSPQRPVRPSGGRVGSNSPLTVRTGSPSRSRRPSSNTAAGNTLHPPAAPSAGGSNYGSTSQVHQHPSIPPPPRSTRAGPRPPAHSSNSSPFSSPRQQRVYDPSTPPRGKTVNSSDSPISPPAAAAEASTSLLSPPPRAAGTSRAHSASPHAGVESPPVSVKVKMHNDGRHVTLRRLNEEEAARERAARARQQGQTTPGSDFSPPPPQRGRFQRQQTGLPPKNAGLSSSPAGGLGSSPSGGGYETGTGTDITDFDSNRRRRRAERARMEQQQRLSQGGDASAAAGGRHVEFT